MSGRIFFFAVALAVLVDGTLSGRRASTTSTSPARSCSTRVFALGLNVLVGYAGLVSLGHAGLFGIAAYAAGFMLQRGLSAIPLPFSQRLSVGLASMAIYAVLALRATGIGFIMITLALGEILWGLAYRWISLTGGDNGISLHGRPAPFGLALD